MDKYKILFFSHSAFFPNLLVGSHHLAIEYVRAGHEVLHVSTPLTLWHFIRLDKARIRDRIRRAIRGVHRNKHGVLEWVPLVLDSHDLRRKLRLPDRKPWFPVSLRRLRRSGFATPDILLMDQPRLAETAAVIQARTKVFRATDFYEEMREDPDIVRMYKQIQTSCQHVVAMARPVAERLAETIQRSVKVVPNGVDVEKFHLGNSPHPKLKGRGRPRLVYIGNIDKRFDRDILRRWSLHRPDCDFIVIGPLTDVKAIETSSNIEWWDVMEKTELPSLLEHCKVGLIPMTDHPANAGRSPVKLYEYGAMRLPVLARATPELSSRGHEWLFLYENEAQSLVALDQALAAGSQLCDKARKDALANSWKAVAEQLLHPETIKLEMEPESRS